MIIGNKKDKLKDIVRDMKRHSSLTFKKVINNNNFESRQALCRQVFAKDDDWKYSSARDFCGIKGLVELSYS